MVFCSSSVEWTCVDDVDDDDDDGCVVVFARSGFGEENAAVVAIVAIGRRSSEKELIDFIVCDDSVM